MPSLTQVTPRLPVSDLNRTIAFYRDHFGFAVNVMWPRLCPTFVILRRDGAGLGFFEPPGHQPMVVGYAELYIEVTDSQMLQIQMAICLSSLRRRTTHRPRMNPSSEGGV